MREFRALASETPSSERNRELFVFHYGHQLNAAHPKLSALRDAVALAKSIAERVLLYVTPVNVDAAARYAGQALSEIMRLNIDVLRSNVPLSIIDWHDALPDTAFFHGDIATEHLNETGRANLARRIVNAHA